MLAPLAFWETSALVLTEMQRKGLPHVWSVLAFVVGLFSLGSAQLVGRITNQGPQGSIIEFGWPSAFLERDIDLSRIDYAGNIELQLSQFWVFNSRGNLLFNPLLAGFDIAFSVAMVVAAALWVEDLCRRAGIVSQFRITSLLAMAGWVGTILVTQFKDPRDYFVLSLLHDLEFLRLFVLAGFWFYAINLVEKVIRRLLDWEPATK